jgi:AcrR family transcriptional regulator
VGTSESVARPRRVDARSNTARIVAASRRVFCAGDSSLEKIATEAGVGIATLYRHFPNREALARAVFDDLFESDLLPLLRDADEADSPRASLMAVAERLLELIGRERGLIAFAGNYVELTGEALQRFSDPLHTILLRAQSLGEIRDDLVAEDIPRFLVMGVAGLSLPGTTPTARRRYLTLIFDALSPLTATRLADLDLAGEDLHAAISSIGTGSRPAP